MNSSDIKIINQLVYTQQELGLCPRSIQQSILRQIEAMEKLSKQPQALYYRDGIPVIEVWDDGTEINATCENAYNDPDFSCSDDEPF